MSDEEEAAAYLQQRAALNLKPWEWTPCMIEPANIAAELDAPTDDIHGRRTAARILQRMLSLGISRWHADPMAAIAEAERKRTAA